MFWECSECAGRCEQSAAPRVCPCCGLASAFFPSTGEELVTSGPRETWDSEATELSFDSP